MSLPSKAAAWFVKARARRFPFPPSPRRASATAASWRRQPRCILPRCPRRRSWWAWRKSSSDRETGTVEVLNFDAVVDCGIPINPALARIQVEGGIVQGIGHTLMEDVTRTPKGAIRESSLFTYRLPTRLDVGDIRVEFEHSYGSRPVRREVDRRDRHQHAGSRDRARDLSGDGRMASRAAYPAGACPARETGGELARRGLGQGLGRRGRLPTRPLLRQGSETGVG